MDAASERRHLGEAGLVQIEVASRLGDWLVVGLAQGFLESSRECVTAVLLRVDGLLEDRLAASGFLGKDPLSIAQLGLVPSFRLVM